MVWFLGVATHARLVQVNSDEKQTVVAMNRLRYAYLEIAGAAAFVVAAGALLGLQRQNLDPLRGTTPRFPTPAEDPSTAR
ncbi:MAG: hypothetical protein ACRDO1_03095 [Nocardioidaceae bacterium]